MKRIIFASLLLASLSSCTQPTAPTTTTTTPSATSTAAVTPVITGTGDAVAKTGSIISLNYTLHKDAEIGPIQETTLESVAQTNGLYKTGAIYKPFTVVLGQGQVIPGFEAGLMGLKKGEKKMIKVTPDQGYGRPMAVAKEQVAPEFSIVRPKNVFDPTFKQTLEKTQFPETMQEQVKNAKVGGEMTGVDGSKAKIVAVDEKNITLEIPNVNNPFAGKKIAVGTTASAPAAQGTKGAEFKITKVEGDSVTLDVVNKDSPFYGKKFAVGESVTPEGGPKITVKEIGDTTVSILVDHPLMNTTLYFDVEVTGVEFGSPMVAPAATMPQ